MTIPRTKTSIACDRSATRVSCKLMDAGVKCGKGQCKDMVQMSPRSSYQKPKTKDIRPISVTNLPAKAAYEMPENAGKQITMSMTPMSCTTFAIAESHSKSILSFELYRFVCAWAIRFVLNYRHNERSSDKMTIPRTKTNIAIR